MVGWKSGTTALGQYILQTQRCLPCTVCCVGRKPANQKTLCTDLQSALNRDVTAAVLCGRGRCESYLKRNSLLWDEWWTRCVLAVWMYGGAVGRGSSNKHTHIGSFFCLFVFLVALSTVFFIFLSDLGFCFLFKDGRILFGFDFWKCKVPFRPLKSKVTTVSEVQYKGYNVFLSLF